MKKLFISGLIIFIVFFIGGTITWFAFDKATYEKQNYYKTFSNNFSNVSVNTIGSEINVIKGKKFKIDYKGDNDIFVSQKRNTLKVTEKRATNRGYGLNFNPFHRNKKKLTLEVPDKKLKNLNVDSLIGDIHLKNLKVKNTTVINHRLFSMDNSNLNNLNLGSSGRKANINDSTVQKGNIKMNLGKILVNHSQLKDSIFLLNKGDILMKNMKSSNDIKASTKQGDIKYNFGEKPKDTLLKLHPGRGKKVVNNKYFKEGKVGKSNNILEFYTVDGDITVD